MEIERLFFERTKYKYNLLIDAVLGKDIKKDFVKRERFSVLMNFHCLIYFKVGKGEVLINDQEVKLCDGLFLVLPSSQFVVFSNVDFTDSYFIFFESDFLGNFVTNSVIECYPFLNPLNRLNFLIPESDSDEVIFLFNKILTELSRLEGDCETMLISYMFLLLNKINRIYDKEHSQLQKYDSYLNPILVGFNKLLNAHYSVEKNVGFYSNKLGISRTYLNSLCIKSYAKTSTQIIKEKLLLEIKKELQYSSKTIAEIAYTFGFSEPSNLNRFFKQATALTPKEFRELSNR